MEFEGDMGANMRRPLREVLITLLVAAGGVRTMGKAPRGDAERKLANMVYPRS